MLSFFPGEFLSRAFFIVPCDIFLAEAFVEQACRSLGQEFAKVLEKRLSFFCFGDGKFFHGKLLYREKFFEIFNCAVLVLLVYHSPAARTSEPFLRVVLLLNNR